MATEANASFAFVHHFSFWRGLSLPFSEKVDDGGKNLVSQRHLRPGHFCDDIILDQIPDLGQDGLIPRITLRYWLLPVF